MYIKTDLSQEQKITLQRIFRDGFTQPHVVAQQLHVKRVDVIALLDRLVQEHPQYFLRKYLIYHICSETPVSSMPDTKTIKQGWICPQCKEEAEIDGLNLEFAYSAIAPVDFVNPDDGQVRYYAINYFPYYIKDCREVSEPVLVLRSGDAQMFDESLKKQAIARQEAFSRVEQEYRDSVCAIAGDLM